MARVMSVQRDDYARCAAPAPTSTRPKDLTEWLALIGLVALVLGPVFAVLLYGPHP